MKRAALALLTAAAIVGCDGSTDPVTGSGNVQLLLATSPESTLPAGVDSAVVRIWHDDASVNVVVLTEIPAQGTANEVDIEVPALAGYTVGVLAFRNAGGLCEVLAGARAAPVDVTPNTVTVVDLEAGLYGVQSVAGPDPLEGDSEATLTAQLAGPGAADFFSAASLHLALEPWSTVEARPAALPGTLDGAALGVTFTVPQVASDTTAWYQFAVATDADAWEGDFQAFVPSVTLMQPLLERAVTPAMGSVTISF